MSNLSIRTRLFLAFGLLVMALAVIVGVSLMRLGALKYSNRDLVATQMLREQVAHEWSWKIHINWVRTAASLKSNNADEIALLQKEMADTSQSVNADQKQLEALFSDDEGRQLMDNVATTRKTYLDARAALTARKKAGEDTLASINKDLSPLADTYLASVGRIADNASARLQKAQAAAQDAASRGQAVIAVLAVCIAIACILFAAFTSRAIVNPLNAALAVTVAMRNGKLDVPISVARQDETGQLLQALQALQQSFTVVVRNVRMGSQNLANASAEIAQGNQDLSMRTENQASALEQTVSNMTELNDTVSQNAQSAEQANVLAQEASRVAIEGGEVVSQVVNTMKGITDSSRRIADIIGVIDGIAFQTNILALNAAVEAARAGEQGRGFAVVASEVRSLAGRSADAAKEIKSLINASVERVEFGTAQVDQAGNTMTQVVNSIQRVATLVGEITASSSTQAQGVSRIGQAVSAMDQGTQQNAAMVEQMAAAASGLNAQAQELVQTVSAFTLDASAHPGSPGDAATAVRKAALARPPSTAPQPSRQPPALRQAPQPSTPRMAPPPSRSSAQASSPAKNMVPLHRRAPEVAKPAAVRVNPSAQTASKDNDEWETF